MSKTNSQVAEVCTHQQSHAHIMVVDDDPVFRRVTRNYLEAIGHGVSEAQDGLEALKLLNSSRPDLVLCDLSMPLLTGMEFAEEVRMEYPSLPVIVISATGDMADVAKALRFGVKDFLTKPIVDYHHLNDAIDNVLQDNSTVDEQGDFLSRWFRLEEGEKPSSQDEQELHWHLQFLQENPNAARELLTALLPEKDCSLGAWRSSYRMLQSANTLPLVFDFSWLMSGQLAFYLVDASSSEEGGIASTLLVRALFDDYIRRVQHNSVDLKDLATNIEKGLECSAGAFPVDALFGVISLSERTLSILPAGLDCRWQNEEAHFQVAGGQRLGENCVRNFMTKDLPVHTSSKLSMNQVGTSSFSWDIRLSQTD
ncbi:two-component system response regulator [Vibrio sp. 10N.286.49.C2]|uniref:response regulator n=1 Tax=unclassified Vibrio TaxID=2614977 RepID=UPI000C8569C3|nr:MULTISPECIES: response regulator [unclassified Vibrio]PMH33778.1 two-component system response regulator [Vibrio sp. 10N.286.49.C2]PMH44035.1 two-component system response regulator [Vibrio sp. 10N.286.49.B1]PMH83078.1 two-component system response regulator [Vibrio sp. 10N.286.48.B7]